MPGPQATTRGDAPHTASIQKVQLQDDIVYKAKVRRDGDPTTCKRFKARSDAKEILGLRWKDLDLAAGTLQLRVDNETSTKGGIRSLPIAAQVLSLLQARRDEIRQAKVTALRDEGLVFPSRVTGSKPISLRTPWETALKRVGIEVFKWHDLRHSAASFRAKGGASLLEIGAVLGHKSANTTKRYAHLTEQHTNALVLDMADKLLGGL